VVGILIRLAVGIVVEADVGVSVGGIVRALVGEAVAIVSSHMTYDIGHDWNHMSQLWIHVPTYASYDPLH